jgi:pimeloyl-ACP methyl ester carboxylesterase
VARDTRTGAAAEEFIHSISVGRDDAPPLVCVPGYGAGAAFFFKNLGPLAAAGYRVHAVDWRGTGLSGRPAFAAETHAEAVSFFLNALEAWRVAHGIDRMSLLGHSLGGYLAARYALAHPTRVERLLLVGPAAVNARPGPPPDTWWYRTLARAWEGGVTPGSVVRALGPLAPGRAAFYAERCVLASFALICAQFALT